MKANKLNKSNKLIALFLIELILILPLYGAALTISNIQVNASDKSAVVTWLTDEESVTKINYGSDNANLNMSVSEVALVKEHSALLRDLEKSTPYFFELVAQTPNEIFLDNKSGEYYKFVTLAEDISLPFIDVDIPSAVDSNELDIIGSTEIDTKIELFVNGQIRRVVDFPDGEIIFYGVDLLPNENNAILIQATDSGGNTAQRQYNVYSDLIAPIITLTPELPEVIATNTINIVGLISEQATINITLNEVPVYSTEAAAFSFSTSLTEGENELIIKASDAAGHESIVSRIISSDMTPPTITNITPTSGSFYYEGRGIIDLQLATEPGAEVRVFRDARGVLAKYDEIKVVGDNGIIRFENVELEGPNFGPYSISGEWPPLRQVQSTTAASLSTLAQQQIQTSERQVRLIIAVRDKAGYVTTQTLSYTIGTCWSGELDFQITPLLEYQSPTLLSPERLEEGSELISFVLNVNYTGTSPEDEWQILDVDLDRACRGGRLGESEFSLEELLGVEEINTEIACGILPNNPTTMDRNSKGTLWYVRYDLAPTERFTDYIDFKWEDIKDRQLIFPLKLTIRYKEKEIDPNTGNKIDVVKTQTKCMSVAYYVDIPIDPSDVLPDWMLVDLPDGLNDTINSLDEVIEFTEEITEFTAIGCLSSLVIKFILKVSRRIRCRLETRAAAVWDKLPTQTGAAPTCPITDEKRMSLPLNKKTGRKEYIAGTPETRPISAASVNNIYTNKQVQSLTGRGVPITDIFYLENSCPNCASSWRAEAALYQAERWLCDRVFCHKAPARWTGYDKGVEDEKIKLSITQAKSCSADDTAGVVSLRKIENCDREHGKYSSDNKLEVSYETVKTCYLQGSTNTLYAEGTDLGPVGDIYTLTKASKRGTGTNKLKVIKEGGNYATARPEKCDEICKVSNKNSVGSCEALNNCNQTKANYDVGTPAGYGSDCWVNENAIENKMQCCCRTEKKEEPTKKVSTYVNCEVGQTPGESCQGWEFREQELNKKDKNKYGTYYPENRYFSGRDTAACFGQNVLFDSPSQGQAGKNPTIDPFRQHISSFQCACLTGIRQRLIMVKSIMTGMMNCLTQIRETGEADAGVCKELFTQYVCDLTYQLYTWAKNENSCSPSPTGSDKGEKPESPLSIGFSEFFGSLSEAGESLSSEYGSTQFSNFLGGGEKQFSRKLCLAAFGFDVGLDFDTFMDMTYDVQFASSVLGVGLRRDFLTYNPDNELSTYAYRGAVTMYPGCDLTSYKVDLTCINQEERSKYNGIDCSKSSDPENQRGCDCLTSSAPYAARSRVFFTGGPLAASSSEDRNENINVESINRYDHIRVQLFLGPNSDPDKCLPTGHDDGIFYFPISDNTARDLLDCNVDDLTGTFKCTRGIQWDQKGEAYFDYFDEDDGCNPDESCNLLCKTQESNYKDCDNIVYEKEDTLSIKAKVKTKGKQCLKVKLDSESGEVYNEIHDVGQGAFESGLGYDSIPFEQRLTTISNNYFGGTGISISARGNCTYTRLTSNFPTGVQENIKTTGIRKIEFEKIEDLSTGTTRYKLVNKPNDLTIYNQDGTSIPLSGFTSEREIAKYYFKFKGFIFRLVPNNAGECTIEAKSATGGDNQKWNLNLELYHPNAQNSCAGADERISVVAEDTSISKTLDVRKEYDSTSAPSAVGASTSDSFKITSNNNVKYIFKFKEKINNKAYYQVYTAGHNGNTIKYSKISLDGLNLIPYNLVSGRTFPGGLINGFMSDADQNEVKLAFLQEKAKSGNNFPLDFTAGSGISEDFYYLDSVQGDEGYYVEYTTWTIYAEIDETTDQITVKSGSNFPNNLDNRQDLVTEYGDALPKLLQQHKAR